VAPSFAQDIITRPLLPDTGAYAETPVFARPKDPDLARQYDKAQREGYLDKLQESIDRYAGSRLKERWHRE
jgi:hypothetical protein